MAVKDTLKNLNSMIKNMEDELNLLTETTNINITVVFELNLGIKPILQKMTQEEIDALDEEGVIKILTEGFDGNGTNENEKTMRENYANAEEFKDKTFTEFAIHIFSEIKKCINDEDEFTRQKLRIENDVNNETEKHFQYINSKEYKERKRNRIEELRKKAESEGDEKKKKEIQKMLDTMDTSESLEFLFERLEKYGEKETKSILDSFFDTTKSELIMKKFASRIPRFGYNKDLYKAFFNFEEKFLPEEYADMNNIFLFNVMRYIAYTDPYNKTDSLFVGSILINMYNLLYHKFETTEMENEFVEKIKRLDDYFKPYLERLTEFNTTSPNHPDRIQRDKDYEERRRLMLIASLQNEGIDVDTTLETEELKKMLEKVIHDKNTKASEETSDNEEYVDEEELHDESDFVANTYSDVKDRIDAIEKSEHLEEFEKMQEEIDTDELKASATVISNGPIGKLTEDDNKEERPTLDSDTMSEYIGAIEKSEHLEEFEKMQEEASDEIHKDMEPAEDFMNPPIEESEESWKDMYNCVYKKKENGMYDYFEENGELIEENVPEDTILKLASTGSITKL